MLVLTKDLVKVFPLKSKPRTGRFTGAQSAISCLTVPLALEITVTLISKVICVSPV